MASFPYSSDTYRIFVGPYHGDEASKRRTLARSSSRMETMPTWNEEEAARIVEAAERWMREHQPPGYTPTPEESQRMSILHSRRQEAGRMRDMGAWQQIHMSLLCLAMASYRRFAG